MPHNGTDISMLLMFCVFFCVSVLLTFNKERVESGRRKKTTINRTKTAALLSKKH